MTERNDNRFEEDVRLSFAMYCDTHNLDATERETLAQNIGDALEMEASV